MYSSVTDEELNTIFEQIINDYERRTETESAGSTEGQTDSEQGNTVQPERESDNEGRTGEVEEQPEPANKTDGESGSVVPEPEGTVDNNGYPFLKSSNETTIFGEIREETGLTPAPIKLSEGFNRKDEKGRNHGYGFKHIEESHGDQIRNYGFESIPEFVESVAKNYTIVRKGNKRNGIDTYILEVSDKKNNTLFVELSKDGSYWNVNSAGVFRKGYSKKKEVVWPLPAVEDASTAEDTGVQNAADSSNSMSGNSPQNASFIDKDTQSLEGKQEDKQKFTASEINQGEGVIEYAQRIAKEKEIWDESQKVDINPTEGQKEAGNYKMGHVKVDGMDITIENPKGSVRSGKDANGKEWSVTMNNTYGYIRGTRGVDGDHIDIFLSDNPESGNVYVIDQVDQQTGMYDESKVMYGFNSIDEARDSYLANYEKGWKVGVISEVSKEEFKKWIESSTNKIKPFSEYAGVKKMQTEDDGTAKDLLPEENVVPVSEMENTTNIEKALRFRETDVNFSDFAAKHKLNEADVKKYAQSMRNGNLGGASYAFKSIQRSIRLQNENLSLGQFVKVFSPIKKELYAKFGDIDSLREEYIQREIEERNMMEAAKKRIEEEAKAESQRLLEFENMSDQEMDEAYFKALENNDKSRMRDIVNESARRKGYMSTGEFRMSHRAPSYDEEGIDKSMIDVANNKDNIRDSLNEQMRMNQDKNRKESVNAINNALSSIEKDGKAMVTIYRAVPKSIKESNVRNGDWVTLSESYAKQHGNHALEGNYRIIKEEVPAENLYWDGNDINEWGYDDRNDYRYKDTKNNRKLNDLVTRDDNGNIIPPSKRFNSRKKDTRFRFIGEQGAANLDAAEEANTRLDNLAVAREMEKSGKNAKSIKIATGWERGADNKWRYEEEDFEYIPKGNAREKSLLEREPWHKELMSLSDKVYNGEKLSNEEEVRFDELSKKETELKDSLKKSDIKFLDDYVSDNTLFKEYPELKQVKVEFYDGSFFDGGSYSPHDMTIRINNNSPLDAKSILVHEVQHAIQHIEGFSRGGNSRTYRNYLNSIKEKRDAWSMIDEFEEKSKELGSDASQMDVYKAVRDEYTSLGMSFGDGIMPSRDAFDKGFNLWVRGYDKEGYEDAYKEYQNLIEKFGLGESRDRYNELSGEVEARNVQSRLNMTPEERRKSLASETEDVAREDQIFLYDSMGANSMTIDENQDLNNIKSEDVEETSKKLNVPVEVITSVDQIKDNSVRSAIEKGRKVKGWYSLSDNKVYVYLPNATSMEDVNQTILHEGVAHYGLRQLVGEERMDDFLDDIFANVTDEVRKKIIDTLPRYGYNSRIATEEYMARMAENGVDVSVWQRIKQAFNSLMRRMGINIKISDNELRYILWRSRQNLDKNKPLDLAKDVAMQYQMGVGNYYKENSNLSIEEENIISDAKANGTYMKAPNGNDTNLNERQWVQVRTKSFKNWFGDWEKNPENSSKVVDDNGEPMVVYHGTNNEFNTFETGHGTKGKGFFFTNNKKMAESYGENIKEVFLNIRDSYEIDGNKRNWNDIVMNLSQSSNDLIKKIKLDRTAKYASVKKGNYPKENYDFFNNRYYKYVDAYDNIKNSNTFIDKIKKAYYLIKLKSFNTQKNISGSTKDLELVLNKGENIIFRNIKDWGYRYITKDTDANDVFVISDNRNVKSATENRGNFDPNNPDIRFRESESDGSREEYERSLQGWKYKAQEAYQDSMLALKNLQEVIAKVSGKPIKSFENAYMAENQLSSKNTSEAEVYYKKHYQPMLQEAGKMMKKYGLTQKGIERYMMLAHGIERNVELTFREQLDEVIKNKKGNADQFIQDFKDEKERLRKLYSGYEYLKELSDYIGGVNDYSATQAILNSMDGEEHDNFQEDALNYVKDFEQTYDVKELWNKTNDATKTTLRKAYDSGMMGKEQYSNVNNMYMYYVPLRGWDEQTAEDVYEYIDSERNPVSSVLKSAKGRKSIPDEIFATIGNMAESAIMQGNRNMMKQSFMSMVINHPTDIATLKKAWYVYDPVKDEWNISMPDIQESDNAETIAEKIKNHEEQMKQLKNEGRATQKSNGLNINYRINKNNISQHVVQVKNGGKDYVIYINGNPRAAQAINGLTNPNVEQNPIFRSIATANRWLAANFTTRNPAFVLSNLVRDLIFSNVAVSIKEDGKYSSRFRKNILKAMPVVLRNLNGKPNNTEADRYFQEFIENGGETGYMHLNDVEKYKKKVRKELSKINGEMGSAKMAMDFAIDRLEDFNRWAEDISRFTTYMTSRQMGRSITESVNDAKEVTVNFNKKGAGYKTGGFFGITSGIFRNLYLFFNASVQSLTNFKRLYDKQPVKFYSALGGFMSAGFLMPMINNVLYSIFGGGDDDPYNDLPEWVRRNNLCIYTGNDTFLTIPLPIELRAFYGLGDYAYQLTTDKEKPSATNIAKGTVGQLADLLPLNPTGNEGLKTFMPDIMSPIFEAYVWNQDFTGKPVAKISPFNERDPEWKRVYKGTSGWLVDTSKFLNDISNGSGPGSEFRKGFIDFNPAKVEHLLESYFGGMAKTFNQAGKTIYYGGKSLIEQQKDEDLVMRNVPIVNRFLNTVDERNAFYGINTEYFNLRDEMDQFKYELNGVKKSGNKDEYKEMLNSDLYDKYQKYKPYQKKLKKLNDMAKESQGEDRKEIEDMIIETRRELLEEVK